MPLSELITDDLIRDLAIPSNIRLGTEIYKSGDVEITQLEPFRIHANVSSGQRRKVKLMATTKGLEWSCTCTKDRSTFCKHCVSLAVSVLSIE
jgi:uncharacterized Zn finger protein